MMGIDLILASLCVNITCDFIRSERNPTDAKWLVENCLPNNKTCEGIQMPDPNELSFNVVENNQTTSLELKGFSMPLFFRFETV